MCRGVAWPELAAGKDARGTSLDDGCATISFTFAAARSRATFRHPAAALPSDCLPDLRPLGPLTEGAVD